MDRHDLIIIGGGAGGIAAVDAALRRGSDAAARAGRPDGWRLHLHRLRALEGAHRRRSPRRVPSPRPSPRRSGPSARSLRSRPPTSSERGAPGHRGPGPVPDPGRRSRSTASAIGRDAHRHRHRRHAAVPPIDGLRAVEAAHQRLVVGPRRTCPRHSPSWAAGPIGVELAQALARLGVAVTVFEGEDGILGREEPRTAEIVADALRADGVDIRLGEFVAQVERLGSGRVGRAHAVGSRPSRPTTCSRPSAAGPSPTASTSSTPACGSTDDGYIESPTTAWPPAHRGSTPWAT